MIAKKSKLLTHSEKDLMEIFWEHNESLTSVEGTQYARQFIPSLTREQYAARLIMSKDNKKNSIATVTAAMINETDETDGEELIQQLEEIIEELKSKGTKKNTIKYCNHKPHFDNISCQNESKGIHNNIQTAPFSLLMSVTWNGVKTIHSLKNTFAPADKICADFPHGYKKMIHTRKGVKICQHYL